MRLVSAADMPDLLPMNEAMPLMREAFRLISGNKASVAHRQSLELEAGTGLLMGAAHEAQGIAAKLVSVMPSNRQHGLPGSIGLLLLMDPETGVPLCLMDGTRLTAIRTAALNACAIELLSRPDSQIALLVGCGTQATAQLEGLVAARDLQQIRVLGTDPDSVTGFIEENREHIGAELLAVSDAAVALEDVDIIIAATNSQNPVLPGALVPPGCHVSGIGSFKHGMCEFDNELLLKSSIFVESRQMAEIEAGELIAALAAGITSQTEWTELGDVLKEISPGRRNHEEITYFKSVGHAVFDLLAARYIWQKASEQQAGMEWQP